MFLFHRSNESKSNQSINQSPNTIQTFYDLINKKHINLINLLHIKNYILLSA